MLPINLNITLKVMDIQVQMDACGSDLIHLAGANQDRLFIQENPSNRDLGSVPLQVLC